MSSEDPPAHENLVWITPVWSGEGYLGTAPDEWEHEFRLPSDEVFSDVKKVGDSVQVPGGTYLRCRFR